MSRLANVMLRLLGEDSYAFYDQNFVPLDLERVRRTRNLRLLPLVGQRRGGKQSYAEWAHLIGIFQTLIGQQVPQPYGNAILDIGCGTGLVGIAAEPFVANGGKCVGLDVDQDAIVFCRAHYPSPPFEFHHLNTANPAYAPDQAVKPAAWPLADGFFDLACALSVWTHLSERDALFGMRELSRVLKSSGKAIVTLFVLDRDYQNSIMKRSAQEGRFHRTPQNQWIFDQPVYGSENWFATAWAKVPEKAIGVTEKGFAHMIGLAGLELVAMYPGNWKENPGIFFQDLAILQKAERK